MEDYKSRTAVYLRKSRSDSAAESVDETLTRHENILKEYAKKNKICVVKTYKEVVSGDGLFTRPLMIQLLNDIEQGLYTAVLCIDIDRLGRSSTKDSGIIMETLRDNNCLIITPDKTYDLADDVDEMTVELKSFFARQELKSIRKRLIRGEIETLKAGGHTGAVPYGYKRIWLDKLPTLEPIPEKVEIVKMIFDEYTNGEIGTYLIADKLNSLGIAAPGGGSWSRSSVRMILTNPVYKGMIVWNRTKWTKKKKSDDKIRITNNNEDEWIVAKGVHEPIISDEQFDIAAELLKERTTRTRFTGIKKNPYSGILFCANCGRPIQRQVCKGDERFLCLTRGCTSSITKDAFDKSIKVKLTEALKELKLKPQERIDKRQKNIKKQLATVTKQLTTIKSQRARLHDFLEQGVYDIHTFLDRQQNLTERQTALEKEIDRLNKELGEYGSREDIKNIIPALEELITNWDNLSAAEANKVLKRLINRIDYHRDSRCFSDTNFEASINWRF